MTSHASSLCLFARRGDCAARCLPALIVVVWLGFNELRVASPLLCRVSHEAAAEAGSIYDGWVRVISGMYRSRALVAPRGLATRPTTDRLRETLFNVLAPRIEGCTFADLFAGSGANGIEALSRSAGQVYFVENAPAALAAIRGNLKTLGVGDGFRVEGRSVAAFLRALRGAQGNADVSQAATDVAGIDIALLDPPYEDEDAYAGTLDLLGGECAVALATDAIVVAEHRYNRPPGESYGLLERYRILKQGDGALSFYRLREEEPVSGRAEGRGRVTG